MIYFKKYCWNNIFIKNWKWKLYILHRKMSFTISFHPDQDVGPSFQAKVICLQVNTSRFLGRGGGDLWLQ